MPELRANCRRWHRAWSSKIWKIVRQHVKRIKGLEVTEQVMLATLSFTKYLMWKDLVDRTEELKRNPVVRHLIDTPTHTYEGGRRLRRAHAIDASVDPSDLFAPMSADSFADRGISPRSAAKISCSSARPGQARAKRSRT